MAEIKSEDQTDPALWNGYRSRLSGPARLPTYDASAGPSITPYKSEYPSENLHRSWKFPEDMQKPSPPTLTTHHSFPSLKRPFHSIDGNAYVPGGQEVRDGDPDSSLRASIHQEHRFLSFARVPDRHSITDGQGRPQSVDIAASIHGMFFLSEMSTSAGDATVMQPELTCYRRNLFQVSGSATVPQTALFVTTEREKSQIMSYEVAVSAVESVDGHSVKLIVIPWKTPPPNSPEVDPTQEQEPSSIPLLPPESPTPDRDVNVYPLSWRRLQFRIATANNGRRKELQQHFVLRVTMHATLANRTKVPICEVVTSPIVVRGRSPRNFQTRKEIPLLGSSTSSRGHGPLTHPAPLSVSTSASPDPKPKPVDRPPYRYDVNSLPASPLTMRPGYQVWNVTQPQAHSSTSPAYAPAPMTMPSYPPHDSDSTHINTLPVPQPSAEGSRPYNYPSVSQPPVPIAYVDSNPRPTKSPRHAAPSGPPVRSASFPNYEDHYAQPYHASNPDNSQLPPQREYYAPPNMQSWAPPVPPPSAAVPPGGSHYHYGGGFNKEDVPPASQYAWSTA